MMQSQWGKYIGEGGEAYFEVSWHREKEVWEEKRKFDLWGAVKIK